MGNREGVKQGETVADSLLRILQCKLVEEASVLLAVVARQSFACHSACPPSGLPSESLFMSLCPREKRRGCKGVIKVKGNPVLMQGPLMQGTGFDHMFVDSILMF